MRLGWNAACGGLCDIFGVATESGLLVLDSGATEAVGSPEAVQMLVTNVQKVMPTAHVEVIKGQWADQNYCEKGGIYSIKTAYRLLRGRGLMSLQYMRTPDEGRSMEDRFENKSHFGFRRVRS